MRTAKNTMEHTSVDPVAISSSISEAAMQVEKAIVEIEKMKRIKNNEDLARQEARSKLNPASKKILGKNKKYKTETMKNGGGCTSRIISLL